MANETDKYSRRRARTSAISTVLGISLVLFMLGMLCLLLLNAQKLSNYVKENIQFQVFINDDTKDVEVTQLRKIIDAEPYTKESVLVTKEAAAEELKAEIGEDFVSFLGYNPLLTSIDIKLNSEYANPDSISWIAEEINSNEEVAEVVYSPDLIRQINENINKISLILLGFSALLMLIAIALINNTIRLAIYSKRLIIRSMQLVGATKGFIQKPFITSGILNGVYAGIIAVLLIVGALYLVQKQIPEFFELSDIEMFAKLFGFVLLLGIIISGISTLFAVRRYLRLRSDKIY